MRIAHHTGRNNTNPRKARGLLLLLVVLVLAPLSIVRAEGPEGPSEVTAASINADSGALVMDLALSHAAGGVRTFRLTSPDRLVIDIENAVLTLEADAVVSWSSPVQGVSNIDISQFSTEPPVVRVVALLTDTSLEADRLTGPDGIRIAVFAGRNPLTDSDTAAPPANVAPLIEALLHETIDGNRDRFVIDFSFGVTLPQVRIESPTVLLLTFPGTGILLPQSSPTNFATAVDGNQVSLMRAERLGTETDPTTEVRLTVTDTSVIGYNLQTYADDSLELILFKEEPAAAPEPPTVEEPVVNQPFPIAVEGGELMVLSSSEGVPEVPDAPVMITRVQFQSINNLTDRFYIYYEGTEPEPRIQRFNYPTRVAITIPGAAVVLPESAGGRFEAVVNGVITEELKVVNRVLEDIGSEAQFMFYFPDADQDVVAFTIDYVSSGLIHVDFYHAAAPLAIENPVELNTSIDSGAPVPEEATVPEPEPVVEEPEIAEAVEEPAEVAPVVEETPAVALPKLTILSGEANDNVISFTITSDSQIPVPQWVEFHYPERIGLKFSLSDVQVLDASDGSLSAYTHIRAIPHVRAIIKDRLDERSTTIAFQLAGKIEEYGRELASNGNSLTVTFTWTPAPEPVVEEPVIDVPAPTPVEPVVAEETPVVVEPEVIEQPVIEEVEVAPEPVIEEPEVVEEPVVQEVEVPGIPTAPGEPPFEAPAPEPELPRIEVSMLDQADNVIRFKITTSEELPVPEWVEYKYPDRLGLRFPMSDVILLGEPGAFTASTHSDTVPIVRAIVKNRGEDSSTTVTFTLGGSLEEFGNSLDWNGSEMVVALSYTPAPAVPEVIEPVVPAPPVIEEAPVVEEVEVQAAPEQPAEPVTEEVEVEVEVEILPEEPVMEETGEAEQESIPVESAEPAEPVDSGNIEVEIVEVESEPVQIAWLDESESEDVDTYEFNLEMPTYTEWDSEFDGIRITDVTFEQVGEGDIVRFETTGRISDWEIFPINYPTKIQIRLPNSRPVTEDGTILRYNEQVGGNMVTQVVTRGQVTEDSSATVIAIYAYDLESTLLLDYDVSSTDNEWAIAVYPKGDSSPFGEILQPQPIAEDLTEPGTPEPRPVRDIVSEETLDEMAEPIETAPAEQKLVNLRFEDAPIRDVLQMIAEQAGLNVSIDASVRGNLTIAMKDVELFDALELLGDQMDFTYYVKSGVYIFGQSRVLESIFHDVWDRWYIYVSYADPDQIRNIITSLGILSGEQIQIYRSNYSATGANPSMADPALILHGERRDMERAYQVIAALDRAPVMIQIDFQILNTSLTDNSNFGIQFNMGTGTGTTNLILTENPSVTGNVGLEPQGLGRWRQGATNMYNMQVTINYLIDKGKAQLMNRTSLTCANNQTGTLFVGERIPYRSTYQVSELGRVTQRIANQTVGLELNVRPHANPDGTVTMYLSPSNSNLLELTDIGPRTVDQRFTSTIRVADGEPFIIGGFIRDEERTEYDRFPFLSELPLLGALFRNKETTKTQSELIFVITPHIIEPTQSLPDIWTDEDFEVPLPEYISDQY